MVVTKNLNEVFANGHTAVALGYFDGVHLGHQKVIAAVAAHAAKGLTPAVFTFENTAGLSAKPQLLLESEEQKLARLNDLGVNYVLTPQFEQFKDLTPEDFVEKVLVKALAAKVVCCGEDYRFGKNAAGDITLLKGLCAAHNILVQVVPPVYVGGEIVSSSRVRRALEQKDMKKAAEFLGRHYSLCTPVLQGKKLGRTINFPTINQCFETYRQPPPNGVYATRCHIGGKLYAGATNVGSRPTVNGVGINAETFIIDYNGDLYGQNILVEFYALLREEQKFATLDELKAAIGRSAQQAAEIMRPHL